MNETLEELKTTASGLLLSERAELIHHLLSTLEPVEDGAAAEWLALAERRMVDAHDGLVAAIPAEQVLESMRRPRP